MTSFEKKISSISVTSPNIIDNSYDPADFISLDLSVNNTELSSYNIADPAQCQAYIDTQLNKYKAQIGFGGYLEERNLYKNSPNFIEKGEEERNIHLGIDIWAPAETSILAPLDGIVHSYRDNSGPGNYGPALILKHMTRDLVFYTLYGHLSRKSLNSVSPGKKFEQGDTIAMLGGSGENGNYAPHLHFQIILDTEGYFGDYPGVCSKTTIEYYRSNCPDPNLLLKIQV